MSAFFTAFLEAIQSGITVGVTMLSSALDGAVAAVYVKGTGETVGHLTDFGYLMIGISGIAIVVGCVWLILGMVKKRR